MRLRSATALTLVTALEMALASTAQAQQTFRFYSGGVLGPYQVDADQVTGTMTSVGATAGVTVLPWLDVEFDLLKPTGEVTRQYEGRSVAFVSPASPEDFVFTRFTNQRRADFVFSAGVAVHPSVATNRMRPRFFVGIVNHRVQDRTVYEHLYVPPNITLDQVNRSTPSQGWQGRNLGGLSIGGSLAIEILPRLSIVPDVRYDYGSIGDEINNWFRTSIRVIWHF